MEFSFFSEGRCLAQHELDFTHVAIPSRSVTILRLEPTAPEMDPAFRFLVGFQKKEPHISHENTKFQALISILGKRSHAKDFIIVAVNRDKVFYYYLLPLTQMTDPTSRQRGRPQMTRQ
jgi:hypothetical protein